MGNGRGRCILRSTRRVAVMMFGTMAWGNVGVAQQSQPALQITSPVNNAVVNAGQTLSVSVTSPANVTFTNVSVIAGVPIKAATIASSVPVQLSLSIPVDIALGKHTLTAVGVSASGQVLYSGPVDIDVERADLPARLTINWKKLIFSSQGDSAPVRVYGVFADGTIVDVTRSSNLVFSSSNASVATVDSNGRVRGIAQGAASITATYTLTGGSQGPQSVTVSLPVTVPPPVITRSPAALNFNDQNVGTSSSAQGVTVTNVSSNPSLSIGPVTASGDFSETDNCASSSPLAVGGLCTINVSFNPTAAGARTGFVSIGDGMDIVHQLVPLSGTGIGQQGTTATVASSANPSVYGQSVALTATVVPTSGSGAPTGTVTFTDGSNTLGTATLSSAQATFSTSTLTVGTHSITIAYSGDANFLPSTSSALVTGPATVDSRFSVGRVSYDDLIGPLIVAASPLHVCRVAGHTGAEKLGFSGPSVLDPDIVQPQMISVPNQVIFLLNEPWTNTVFYNLLNP